MKPFLETVASHLYHTIGNDLSHTAIVFPNKRAGLFFSEYLARQSSRPVWSPAYLTINELFTSYPLEHPLTTADPITLVCQLYEVFIMKTGRNESLDDFYFWGELLISDFDDIDKNLVDTQRLFSNLQELHALTQDSSFLTPEQQEAISQFFTNFSPERRTLLKERFISLWDRMLPIYTDFKVRLAQRGIAYEGMLERQVMEQFDISKMPYERYVFVGFNVLNRVEQQLFRTLRDAGKALFYWDYDESYTTPSMKTGIVPLQHEAGEFILRNLREFPNQLDACHFTAMSQPKQIAFIESPTENAQARYLTRWVRQLYAGRQQNPFREKENAVVLCNEALLLPVLHAIPDEVENVNITMGYPLSQTPIYSLLNALCTLQIDGYRTDSGTYTYETVRPVLNHPYVRRLSQQAERLERDLTQHNRFFPLPSELQVDEPLRQLFTPVSGIASICQYLIDALRLVSTLYRQPETEDNTDASGNTELYDQLYRESIFKTYTLVNRLYALAQEKVFGRLQPLTFRRLLGRLLSGATIPFHGEPAIGMQVMGVLETRNLDFRNLLMLSVNEGKLPKSEGDASFVPYNLRKAFGMTTIDHKNC
ncbi:MAG: PD-(D/E)XK nuclease family protein, partial [Bacteroides sp.]